MLADGLWQNAEEVVRRFVIDEVMYLKWAY